jgi:hypothetical protein
MENLVSWKALAGNPHGERSSRLEIAGRGQKKRGSTRRGVIRALNHLVSATRLS